MAKLEDLFRQRSKSIYNKYPASETQPVVIKPDTDGVVFGSRSRILNDSRAIPTVSTARDLRRISKFLTSPEGILFIAKQALLQTGNTFSNTLLYNVGSVLVNTVPFVHSKRHSGLPTTPGVLQDNTVDTVSTKFTNGGVGRGLIAQLKGVARGPDITPFDYKTSRPEYKTFTLGKGPVVFLPQPLSQRGIPTVGLQEDNRIADFVSAARAFRERFYDRQRIKFSDTTSNRLKSRYFEESSNGITDSNNTNPTLKTYEAKSTLTGIVDKYNIPKVVSSTDSNKINYDIIKSEVNDTPDIIKFIFTDEKDQNPIRFRALISSIKESIKTEFNEQRYVGRTERFVTYGGAKRSLSLTFNVVAFSSWEIQGMWNRINYLSGLAFPKGVTNGFMTPPLFKMTIGNLYENQPCYIESLDYDFLDETITFDVNNEVPMVVNVNMQVSILEKRSKFYNSPFYKIVQDSINVQTQVASSTEAIPANAAEKVVEQITQRTQAEQFNEYAGFPETLSELIRKNGTLFGF